MTDGETKEKTPALSEIIRAAITASEFTVARIAAESGVDRSQLSRFLSGERDLRLESAGKVCEVLGLELKQK